MNLKDFYAKYGKNLYEIMIPITHFKERKRKNMGDRFKELSSKALEELTQVFGRMDDSTVRELLEEIKKTKRIFLLAAGREGLATKAFAMRLMHLGKEAFWIWDDTTPSIGEGDLMICACGSANVGHENYVADMAKKNGAKLALLTPSSEGFLLSIADFVVNIPAAAYKAVGEFVPSEQLMGNLFEQTLFIFYDILVMMLREEMEIQTEEMVARHRNVE